MSLVKNEEDSSKLTLSIRPHDFPDGFIMTPVIDGKPDEKATIALIGNMMPVPPFKFGGELRKSQDYYPGNPEPVVHVIGSQETDLTINGRFKSSKALSRDLPWELCKKLDNLRIQGSLLKLSMGEWVRYGFLTGTSWEMKDLGTINYSLTFFIMSFFEPRHSQVIQSPRRLPFYINDQLIKDALDFHESFRVTPISGTIQAIVPSAGGTTLTVPRSLSDILNSEISKVASAIAEVTGFVDKMITEVENVEKSYVRALGTIKHALTSLIRFRRRIAGLASNAEITTNSLLSMLTKMSLSQHFSKAISGSLTLSLQLEKMRQSFATLSQSIPLARHRVRVTDTLQSISTKWYGNPHEWKKIKDHNRLTSTQLVEGTVLEVPKL